jgi:hypothetical protein
VSQFILLNVVMQSVVLLNVVPPVKFTDRASLVFAKDVVMFALDKHFQLSLIFADKT